MYWSEGMQLYDRKKVLEFFQSINDAESSIELWSCLKTFSDEVGLKHIRVSIYDLHSEVTPDSYLHVNTYPTGPGSWGNHYIELELFREDRSFNLTFEKGVEVLEWEKMDEATRAGSGANRVFEEMRNFGIGNGWLIAKSSPILGRMALLGIAGPGKVIKELKRGYFVGLQACFELWLSRYLRFAIDEKILRKPKKEIVIFSDAQREILKHFADGLKGPEIAKLKGISSNGINQHVKKMKEKTGLTTIAGLAIYAKRTNQIM